MAYTRHVAVATFVVFSALCTVQLQSEAAPTTEELVREGLELRRDGRDADALPKFEGAYNQAKTPRTAAQWGLCLQALARWSEAEPLLMEALSARQDSWIKKNRDTLKESLEVVKAHVGRIEVIGEPQGATVTVGGRVVGKLPLASAITVNEGSVDVEVSSPGYKRAVRTLNVTGASYQQVVQRLEEASVAQAPPAFVATSADSAPREEATVAVSLPATSNETRPITKSPWFWGGVGAAILVGAVAVFVLTSNGDSYPRANDVRSVP